MGMLLEAWKDFEREDGDEKSQAQVGELMPRRVKKRRKIETEDGSDQGWEEYFDYIFPEDEAAKPKLKLLRYRQKMERMLQLPKISMQMIRILLMKVVVVVMTMKMKKRKMCQRKVKRTVQTMMLKGMLRKEN